MLQFIELKDNLLEFKAEFDLKLQDEQLKNLELQKKIRLLSRETSSSELIESFESEISKLSSTNSLLIKENESLYREMLENQGEEALNLPFLNNIKNNLMKSNKSLLLKLQEKDKEISEQKRKERSFLSQQKVLHSMNNRNSTILKSLSEKENQEKKVVEICIKLEKENDELKKKLQEVEKGFKSLSEEYFKNKEQLFLFKEMAVLKLFIIRVKILCFFFIRKPQKVIFKDR